MLGTVNKMEWHERSQALRKQWLEFIKQICDYEIERKSFGFLKDASDNMSVIFHNYILEYKE